MIPKSEVRNLLAVNCRVVPVLREAIRLMAEIDAVIDAHGGWPIA